MSMFMLVSFTIQTIGCLSVFLYAYYTFGYPVANTMTFILSATFELFVVWNCRSETRSVWRMGKYVFKNKFFVLSVLVGLAVTIALPYIPVLSEAFHVVPLTLEQWAITIGVASLGLFLVLPEFWMGRKIWKWK